jgi:large subunit ribosomal protein L24
MSTVKRVKTGDTVKIISGGFKGKVGKIVKVSPKDNLVFIEGINTRVRHTKPSRRNPGVKGGKKDVHLGIHASNVKLIIDTKLGTTSRIGYSKNADGKTIRVARQANNREVK